jgi:hypothetical protein
MRMWGGIHSQREIHTSPLSSFFILCMLPQLDPHSTVCRVLRHISVCIPGINTKTSVRGEQEKMDDILDINYILERSN